MPARAHRKLETEVAHHRADHRTRSVPCELARARDDVQQLIAIDDAPQMIDHDQPVAVAIECQAHVGAHARHRQLQQVRRGRAAAVIDVAAVGRAADRHDLGAEVGEDARADLVGRAVGAVDDDLKTRKVHPGGQRRLRRTAGSRCANGRRGVARPSSREARVTGACCRCSSSMRSSSIIRELSAGGVEEFDAVVVVEIVRGADHRAEVALEAARHVGNRRAWAADRSASH